MELNIKKSFNILSKSPAICLLLVTYLLIAVSVIQGVLFSYPKPIFFVVMFLLFLLTSAFLSGWFGAISNLVKLKENTNPDEDLKERYYAIKNGFFASIPSYMLQVSFYLILFILVVCLSFYLVNRFWNPNEIMGQVLTLGDNQDALLNFLQTADENVLNMLFKRIVFLNCCFLTYFFLTLYVFPALYLDSKKNLLLVLFNGIKAIFKKFFKNLLFFVSIVFLYTLISVFEFFSMQNQILMFIMLVIRVSFIAYIVVLIFSVYERNFANNCDNGSDCVRENDTCN